MQNAARNTWKACTVPEPLIRIANLYKIFGKAPETVLPLVQNGQSKDTLLAETGHTIGLRDINLTVKEGEVFVVMGLSGSGKSTLIRHLNRLIKPTTGLIHVGETDVLALDRGA